MRARAWIWLTWTVPTKAQRYDARLKRAYARAHHHERYRPW